MNLRHRGYINEESGSSTVEEDFSKLKKLPTMRTLNYKYWLLKFVVAIMAYSLAVILQSSCAFNFLSQSDDCNKVVCAHKMRTILLNGTSNRDRCVGSTANEIDTPQYLRNLLLGYKAYGSGNVTGTLDEQLVEYGDFNFGSMPSIYRNIRNIAFRIHDSSTVTNTSSNKAVLVNCHYDSVLGSPGASDNFVNCVILLDVIRVILKSQVPLRNDLIFLFNGAEENMLQGSHAFVTQHRWWRDVIAAINLESAGGGGRRIMFQASRDFPELVDAYADTSSRPLATVAGQDIFDAGLIPSDTDFRIFNRIGGVPGVDLAYISNGYVYHTANDVAGFITNWCLRNEGNNILKYLVALANLNSLNNTNKTIEKLVYFDFLGLFLIRYSSKMANIINISCICLVFVFLFLQILKNWKYGIDVLLACLNHILCVVGMTFFALVQAYLFHFFGKSMCWYSIRLNAVGVYVLPILTYFVLHYTTTTMYRRLWPTPKISQSAHFDAALLLMAILLSFLTWVEISSGYIVLMWVIFPLFGKYVFLKLFGSLIPIYNEMQSLLLPYIYHIYFTYTVIDIFIPIMGRSNTQDNPETTIAVLVLVTCVPILLFYSSQVCKTSLLTLYRIIVLLVSLSIIYTLILMLSNLGFPYSRDIESPRKQRLEVVHVNRIFHGNSTTDIVESRDSGLWLVPKDVNKFNYLDKEMTQLSQAKKVSCMENEPYCGFPYLHPDESNSDVNYYIPAMEHQLQPLTIFKVNKIESLYKNDYKVSLSFDGPSHTHLFIMTGSNVHLIDWSLSAHWYPAKYSVDDNGHVSNVHYFVYHSYGLRPKGPLQLWARFQVVGDDVQEIRFALSGHFTHGKDFVTSELKNFVRSLPTWVVPTYWSATYERWIVKLN